MALTSSAARVPGELRAGRITPLQGNLDDGASLRRLAGLATRVLHLAPPPNDKPDWRCDPRTLGPAARPAPAQPAAILVYASTSGVYGDCGGEWVRETRP
jgi:hypothetical protein